MPPDLNDNARRVLMADIAAAVARVIEYRRVDIDVSVPPRMLEVWRAPSSMEQSPDEFQDNEPAELQDDDTDGKLIDHEEPATGAIASRQQPKSDPASRLMALRRTDRKIPSEALAKEGAAEGAGEDGRAGEG